MNRIRITGPAARDIESILAHSQSRFGDAAAERYQSLILKGLTSIRDDPDGRAVRSVDGFGGDLRMLHLRSIEQRGAKIVARPRHWVVFRRKDDLVRIIRVLHDRMSLERQLR